MKKRRLCGVFTLERIAREERLVQRASPSQGFPIKGLPRRIAPEGLPPTSLFCFIYKRGYLDKNFIQKIQTSSFLQKVRIVFRRSCYYKKERPMALMLMAPAQILRQQKICGKTCGAKGVPPKPLKGSHTSASLVRCQRHRASELLVLLVFLPKLLCFAASGFCSLLPDPDVRLHPTSGCRPRASRHRNASASRHSSRAAAARTDSR